MQYEPTKGTIPYYYLFRLFLKFTAHCIAIIIQDLIPFCIGMGSNNSEKNCVPTYLEDVHVWANPLDSRE